MFLQIHFLTSYHASLLNRDDAGLAKRITFGGTPRIRVSSQSQKRHWREWLQENTDVSSAWRTRNFFGRVLVDRVKEHGVEAEIAHDLVHTLATRVLHASGGNSAIDPDSLTMKQPVLFGEPEARYFTSIIIEAARFGDRAAAELSARIEREKTNFSAMMRQNGLHDPAAGFEGALFGRFVTSDVLARVDAPVHVAHAFTTHALETEVDYFTVVDDLARNDETGAAHANDMELGSGIFYGYVVVDIPLLISNLTGCTRSQWQKQDWAGSADLLNLLLHAVAEVSPGAKLGSTAPYARAQCVVLEVGRAQPRSLANAFLKPIRLGSTGADPIAQSIDAMAKHLTGIERMYGSDQDGRWVSCMDPWPRAQEETVSFQDAINGALEAIGGNAL